MMTLSHQKREKSFKTLLGPGTTVKGRALFYHPANEPDEGLLLFGSDLSQQLFSLN